HVEVVQVAQVGWHRPGGGFLSSELGQERRAAAADLAEHEQVVVGLVHGQAETGGLFGALLADPGHGLAQQFAGVGERQRGGIDDQSQLFGFGRVEGHGGGGP
ncbi:hypothetical protein RZS08_63790, partial [Arthrospira platensis SPKY1]|nr:hypothetical protein [Arthrospira platensis SPKY1]